MNKPWKKDSCSYFTDKYLLLFLPPLLPYFLPSNLLSSLPSIIFFLFLRPFFHFFFPPLLPSSFPSNPLLCLLFFSSYSFLLPFLFFSLPSLRPSLANIPVRFLTSNGGCRREEKSRKHWSLFTKLLSLVTANLFFY